MLLGTKIEDMSNKCSDYMELMRDLFEVRHKLDRFEKFESQGHRLHQPIAQAQVRGNFADNRN